MSMGQDELQEKLEALEAGEPLDVCVSGLDEEEVTLLHLAANLQQIPVPPRAAEQISAQRATLMEKVHLMETENRQTNESNTEKLSMGQSKIGTAWASFRAWIQNADKYDWAVVGAMAPAIAILIIGLLGALLTTPASSSQGQVIEDEAEHVTETAVDEAHTVAETTEEAATIAMTQPEENTAVSNSPTFSPQYAALNNLNGVVRFQTNTGDWQIATADTHLQAGQRIQTGSLSSATLAFYDGSVATMGPNSELWIDALSADPDGIRVIAFTQWSGITDHQVAKVTTEGSLYEVRTPTAVSSAKGTEFTVMMTDDLRTRINVDEGAVAVTGQENTVLTVAGQTTAVDAGEEPTEPTYTVTGEGEVNEIGETWIIAGQPFLTDGNTIIIGNPQVGDIVFVKGHLDETSATVADVIGLLRPEIENSFTLSGIVNAMGDAWSISGQSITTDENTFIEEGIQLEDDVLATGIILEDGTFLAQEISLNNNENEDPFEFSGVAQAIGTDEWTISGVTIAIGADTEIEADIAAGDTVKVEGLVLEDGTWLATEIKAAEAEASPFEFTGVVDSIDPWTVAGIDLTTNDWTEIKGEIVTGDRVKVEGVIQTDGTWLANEIKLADDELDTAVIEFIGTVESSDPWLVNGITLTTDEDSQIGADIDVGTAVQVTAQILPDGTLLILNMQPITEFGEGCLGYTSLVMVVGDGQITLLDGSTIALNENIVISGELVPGAVVMILTCTDADGVQTVTSIVVLYILDTPPVIEPTPEPPAPEPPPAQPSGKVTLCHNASKNNPHNITVDQAAVNTHLGHGDTMGGCP